MGYRKTNSIIIVVAALFLLKGVVDPIDFRLCDSDEFTAFVTLGLSLLLPSLILFFLPRQVFITWAKFAAIGFPIMLGGLLYAFNIEQSTGSWICGPTEAEIASAILPSLFLLISLVLIIRTAIKSRRV